MNEPDKWTRVELDGLDLICSTVGQWRDLCAGAVAEIEGTPVLEPKLMRGEFNAAMQNGALVTDNTHTFLHKRAMFRKTLWVPLMLLWPEDTGVEQGLAVPTGPYVQVYFHRFHCFDCGLDLYGYAIDVDAYKSAELQNATQLVRPFKPCPRCHGGMRHPMLVQIHKICD